MYSLELIFPITKQGFLKLPLHGKIRSRLSRFFQSMVLFAKGQYRISIKNCSISVSTPMSLSISLAAPNDKWSTNSISVTVQPNWTLLLDYREISVVSIGLNQRTVNQFHFCTDYTSASRVAFTILLSHSSVHLLHALNWLHHFTAVFQTSSKANWRKLMVSPLFALKGFLVAYTLCEQWNPVPGHLSQVLQGSPHHRALQLISAEKQVVAE